MKRFTKQYAASNLLEAPAPEVVQEFIEEIWKQDAIIAELKDMIERGIPASRKGFSWAVSAQELLKRISD